MTMSLIDRRFIAEATAAQNLTIEVTSDVRDLQAPLQTVLAGCARPTSIFLTYEWLLAAARWQPRSAQPLLVVIRLNGTAVGVAPLRIETVAQYGVRFRECRFLTVPDAQLCSIICADAHRRHVCAALAAFLIEQKPRWDVLRLAKLDPSTGVVGELEQAFRHYGLSVRTQQCGANHGVDLCDDWPSYYARRSRRLKKGNNLVHNRLHKRYSKVEVIQHHHELQAGVQLDQLMDTLEIISSNSWKTHTGLTLDNAGPSRFIRTLSDSAANNRWLSVWLLQLDGEPVAFEYQLVHGGCVYALRADYRNDYEDVSPGTYLNWQILHRLFETEHHHYFMGPGSNPYKARWAETESALLETHIYAGSLRARMLHSVNERLKPAARRLLHLVRKTSGEGTENA